MSELAEELGRELRLLPRYRGLHASEISSRVGPALRQQAGISAGDDDDTCREKLIAWMGHLLSALPAREQLVMTVALGLHAETRDRTSLGARLNWMATQQERDVKTIRRWLAGAQTRMANAAAREARELSETGWYVASLVTYLLLDRPSPVAQEVREIVATRNGIRQITHRLSLPRVSDAGRTPPRLDVHLDYGGRLALTHASATDFRYIITLPGPLSIYDRHRYQLSVRIPDGREMSPHYICVPQRQIDAFDLLVRFDPARIPQEIRLVDDDSPRSVDDRVSGEVVAVNDSGEARVSFRRLRQGRSYGLQWG